MGPHISRLIHGHNQKGGNAYNHAVTTLGGSSHHSHHIDTENLSSLKDYEKSYASKAKEDTIKKMARAMKKVGMNVNPDDDLDKIINDLNREIPNPKKGKTFASESKTQEKVCRIVAGVLNDEFTPGAPDSEKFIDMTLPPIEICRAVGEYTHSFNQGVNTEFLGVIGSVKNALHSMNLMDHVMDELYKKIQANIGKVDDSILEREIKPLNDVYIRAKHEREQKKMVLENLLHVHLEPASRVLNDALKEHGNDLALVKKLGLKLGSTDFANAIAAALSGLGSTASIANHVHKALKTVGISMNEYINSHSFKEFQQKLDSIVDEGKMNDKDLVKFLHASKYLREGFDYRTDEKFKKIIAQGGRAGMMGGQYSGGGDAYGGRRSSYNMDSLDSVDTDVFGNPLKSSIRRKARKIMAEKELISKDFVIRLDRHYNELLEAMKDIAINLGKTIPLTTKTELLKDALQHLDEASSIGATEEMSIELIISRGIDTMDARRKKEQYINKLKMIANACESIMGMEAYRATSSKFAKVKDVVGKIEKMIDYYSNIGSKNRDRMSDVGEYDRKYADSIRDPSGTSRHSEPSRQAPVQSNSDDEGDSFAAEGGASNFEYKEIDVPQIAKTGLTLNEIINTFNYYYYLAGVRNNLKISSREYDLFGEDYSNMLGNSIAKRLYELDLAHKEDIKFINENLVDGKLLPRAGNTNDYEKFKTEAKKWVDSEYNIKIKFYKALQALDLYLKEFTPAITSNIDTVKEIKTMLDETQVIARWFNESTGNELCEAFDQLPGYSVDYATGNVTFTDDPSHNRYPDVKATSHYYKGIHDKASPAAANTVTFGNPVYGRSILYNNGDTTGISKVKVMKDKVDGAIDHFQALKNIVNTFIRIGNKFGSTDLSTKVFMSPSQIYRVLFNFLKQSALRMHVPNKDANNSADNDALMLETPGVDEQNIVAMGVIHKASKNGGNDLVDHRNGHFTVAPFSVYFTGFANKLIPNSTKSNNHYEIENVFFHAMLKAMAGKIMTVVSSYDMLEMAPPKHWITDTRMILGGGMKQIEGGKKKRSKGHKSGGGEENPVSSDDRLEIIQEALPLYFKLPRLIEFYKDILEPNALASKDSEIVFLPDLDGLFTSLFLLIFRRSKTPENGEYSDMELHKIVEEINSIYRYYAKQKSHDITTAVINDVVLDVNRKYGLMKKDDYNTWVEMTKERNNNEFGQIRVNTTNYSILPDEDEYEVNKFAPSDIYKGITRSDMMYDEASGKYKNRLTGEESEVFSGETPDIADKTGTARNNTMHPHAALIKAFREKLDNYFKDSEIQNMSSYTILVHQAEDDVKNARSNREKISTVFQLIQGTGNLGLKNDKAILFHETIIAGLNVLSGIYMMLKRYKENIEHSDPLNLEKKLVDILYGLLCAANKTVANQITFQIFTKNGNNDTYTIGIGNTVQNANAAEKERIGQCHLLDGARTAAPPTAPTLKKGGSYFFNDGISDDLFSAGDTRTKHQVSEKEHPYLIQPIMIDEPIFRGTKILPYYHIQGGAIAEANMEQYANDVDNLYDIKRADQASVATNTVVRTINLNAPQFYSGDYGDGTVQTDIYANSHPTYRILETIVTKVNTTEVSNRLFSNSKAVGVVPNEYVLPSTIIDYESKKNYGVLNANALSIRDRLGALAADSTVTDSDKKNLLFMRLLSRTGVNHQYIMENLLENMYSLIVDSNGLIDLTYYKTENNKTKLNLNFTKLQNVVNGIITDLKFYLEYFRPFLKKDVIKHYEDADKAGSIYDLEVKFNYFFNPNTDMYNTGYRGLPRADNMNAEQLSDTTSKIFNNLTRDTHVAMSVLKQLLPGVIHVIPDLTDGAAMANPERCRHYNERLIFGANQMGALDGVTADGDTIYSMYDLLYNNYIHNSDSEVESANNVPANAFVKFQYKHTTRYEWYGGTMSNLIFYDFSKKMPYNRIEGVLPETITPTFTVEDQIIKIDDLDANSTKYKDARFATEFYCYPHGHFKLRELLGSPNTNGDIKALDMQVNNAWAGAAAIGESVKSAQAIGDVSPIVNIRTLYRYTAISMFSETTLNAKMQDSNPFKFDEYIQLSAQRMAMRLGNSLTIGVFNTADFGVDSHYPTMELLDIYSYPVNSSNMTKNYGYNMGICVKDPKLPSKDFEYKLHDLIARSPKTSDSRASAGHLIQWPNTKNVDSAAREYIRAPLYSHECVAFDHNSLMFIFNQILSRFLNAFIDPSTGNKIYKNLVNGFINGVSSKVVSQPDTGFPDLYRCGTNAVALQRYVAGHSNTSSLDNQHSMMFQKVLGLRGDVKPDSIVFQSLAYILQRIGKDLDRGSGSNLHLLNTLTDVPIYMKESYKANLPSFIKIFDYIIQKAEFFKNIIQKTDIKLNRYSQCDFANFINSCTGLTDVRVNDVRYELHSYFVPAKYLLGLNPLLDYYNPLNLWKYKSKITTNIAYNLNINEMNNISYRDIKNFIGILHLIRVARYAEYVNVGGIGQLQAYIRGLTMPRIGIELPITNILIAAVNAFTFNDGATGFMTLGANHDQRRDNLYILCIHAFIAGIHRALTDGAYNVAVYNGANPDYTIEPDVGANTVNIYDPVNANVKKLFLLFALTAFSFKNNETINTLADAIIAVPPNAGNAANIEVAAIGAEIADNLLFHAVGNNNQNIFNDTNEHFNTNFDVINNLLSPFLINGPYGNYAADYPDFSITPNQRAIRRLHPLYNSATNYHIAPFNMQLDKIHSADGMIRRTALTAKEDLVKISCTRGTRGYNLPFRKAVGNESIFRDYTYNYEFLKITDKNANRVNGFLSIDGIDPLTAKNQSSDDVKEKLLSILDSIVANAYSMSDCCDEVLKELGDTPVYFETYDGSIENYQVRNNADQLMPLSLTLWFMNNNYPLSQSQHIGPSHVLFSGHNLSTPNFKLLYGTRQVLARNLALTYEEIPGVKTILARHNSSASDRPLEESRYLQFVNRLMTGLRFIVNSHGYKRVVAYNSNGVEPIDCQYVNPNENTLWKFNEKNTQFVGTNNTTHLLHFQESNNLDERNTVYALKDGKRTRELLLQLLEDSFQENSVNKILQAFYINEKQSNSISRKQERIKVIIDSSINPINVHALMQDIPLANIYNYQYTFETMAASMYGMLMRTVSSNEATNETKHPLKQTILEFLRLLRDPFAEVDKTVFSIGANYEQPLFNIFIGDGSLGMGRPKFLSDQLFNKCLLNNIYYENTRPMVKGPAPRRGADHTLVVPGGLTDAAAAGAALFTAANAANSIYVWLTSAPVVAPNGIFNDIFAAIRAYELVANAGNGGAGTNPALYLSTTNDEKLFRFIFNGENNANGTAADQLYLAANDKYWGITALVRSPAGAQDAINWQLFNTFLGPAMPNPAVGNRYAELLRRSEYFARFKREIMAQPLIIDQFILHFGIKFATFAKLQARFELILEAIFRIIFLLAIIGGDGANFLVYALNQAAMRGAPVGILGYADALIPAGNITINSVASLIRIGLFQNFNGVDPIVDDTNLTQLANAYNTLMTNKLARFPQGYNRLAAAGDLVMSYLKEYQYRGPFNQNTYDGAVENTSNPLVRFEYAAGGPTESLRHTLQNIGYLRFNTNVIRNLFFISNILRIIRLQINREFTQNRSILKSSHFAISPSVTEYGMMDPNESFNSTYRDANSFNDRIENYSNKKDTNNPYYDLIDEDDAL